MIFSPTYPFVIITLLTFISAQDSSSCHDVKSISSEDCGTVKFHGRITGGQNAFLGQFPWMASLVYHRYKIKKLVVLCGGALLNQYYVLTSAHCISGREKHLAYVRLGENFAHIAKDCENGICAPPPQDMNVEKLILHPKFNNKTRKNDIGLVRLQKPVQYNDFVSRVCLPYGEILEKNYMSEIVEVAGWGGVDSYVGYSPSALHFARIPVVNPSMCNKMVPEELKISDNTQLCVGTQTGVNACTGDSGGPLMTAKYAHGINKNIIIGVVSYGDVVCENTPTIFTNVIPYTDWIINTIQLDEKCVSNVN